MKAKRAHPTESANNHEKGASYIENYYFYASKGQNTPKKQ